MTWLLAACLSIALFTGIQFSTLVPLVHDDTVDYLFIGPTLIGRLTAFVVGLLAPTAAFMAARWLGRRIPGSDTATLQSGRWLAPVAALACVVFGLLPTVPGVGERGAVAGYILYNLRWWWLLGAIAWSAYLADRALTGPIAGHVRRIATWSEPARLLLLDATLFFIVIGWALSTSTYMRFGEAYNGDEPKYLRYCELWYQGGGLAVSQKMPFVDQPVDASPGVLRNGVQLESAIREDAVDLVHDIRSAAAHPTTFR